MQGEPVQVGRDVVSRPIIAQIVLSFPWGVHDKVIGPGKNLSREEGSGEKRLHELVTLRGLSWIVDWIR